MSSNLETNNIDTLVREMVFGSDSKDRQVQIRQMALEKNIFPASIQSLYKEIGKGNYSGFTVPAMNLRGITYEMARAAFRAALKHNVGALIFEIARSEMSYTLQTPGEYAGCVLAAAIAEGFEGPVFLQGDHIQIRRANYAKEPRKELDFARSLIKDLIEAGFYNIDIDASTLVDIDKADLVEQQKTNGLITAEMTRFIRLHQPANITISIGGEIGEIGSGNSTVEDLRAFMQVYNHDMAPGLKGISKISVQTGTTHGGVVLPDGRIADVQLDFDVLEKLSRLAREEYSMGGAVQHGASTLPDECFDIFPRIGTLEVHLATGFQNIVFDSPDFPKPLLEKVYSGLATKYASDRKSNETEAQFNYRNRKRSFGDFKKDLWDMPPEVLGKIGQELEDRFSLLYQKLNAVNTRDIVNRVIKL